MSAAVELERLEAELRQAEASAQAPVEPPAGAPAEPPADYAAEVRSLLEFAHASLSPLYPHACAPWTAEVRERVVAAATPVAHKYGFSWASWAGQYGAELLLLVTVVPLIAPTVQGLKRDRAAPAGAAQAAPPPATAPVEAAPSVPPPTPVDGAPVPPAPRFVLADDPRN